MEGGIGAPGDAVRGLEQDTAAAWPGVADNVPPGALATDGEEQWADETAILWEREVLTDLGPG